MQERPKEEKDGTVQEDQKERGYYYDDAHGYKEFDPEDEGNDEESEGSTEEERGQARLPDLRM